MKASDQPSENDFPLRAKTQLRVAEEKLRLVLVGVDARAAFASYALCQLERMGGDDVGNSPRPAPASIEMGAWLLFPHFGQAGSDDAACIQRVIDAVDTYQVAYGFGHAFPDEEYDELDMHLRLFTGNIRGSAYPVQVRRRIERVFEGLEFEIRSRVGIGPLRAVELAMAIVWQTESNVNAMRKRFAEIYLTTQDLYRGDGKSQDLEDLEVARNRWIACLAELQGSWIPDYGQISQRVSDLTLEEWQALHANIGYSMKTMGSVSRVVDMQDRPIYWMDAEHAFSLQGTTVLDAIFSFYDDWVRGETDLVNRYAKAASVWMETEISDYMKRLFPGSSVLRGACFKDPDHEGGETEADVVVHWGPFLVILEAKNSKVPKTAVRGGGKGLRNVISKNVQDAFLQARRVIRVLDQDETITFRERVGERRILTIARDRLRRIMPISVTLQHLFGITTQLAVTQRLGLFKGNAYPWSVSIDDLDVITRFAGNPDVFLYYIERRTAHQSTPIRLSGDELDFFGQYLDNRLHPSIYEERDETLGHSGFAAITVSGGEEKFEPFFTSQWYGEPCPTEIPGIQLPDVIHGLLNELRLRLDDGARYIGFALLSLNHQALMRIEQAIIHFRNGPGPDRQILRTTLVESGIVVNIMVHQSLGFDELFQNMMVRTQIEHYRARAKATVTFGIDLRNSKPFEIAQWLEGDWKFDSRMEAILQSEAGHPRTMRLPVGARAPGRNDPCPCGSGKKFKKCCFGKIDFHRNG